MNVRLNLLKVRKYVDLMFKSNIKNMKILYPAIEFLSQHGCEKASLILGEYYRSSVLLDMEGCEYSKRRYLIGSEKYRSPNIKKAEFYLTKSRQQGHVIASYYLMDIYNLWIPVVIPTIAIMLAFALSYLTKYIMKSRDFDYQYKLATIDGLTELYNHRYFQEQMIAQIDTAKEAQPTSV